MPEWVHISDGMSWDADTGKLEKVSGEDWEEGATGPELSVSSETYYVTWQGDEESQVMIGLTAGGVSSNENYNYEAIDCAMFMDEKKLRIYEMGEKVFDEDLEYTADDVLGLGVDGTVNFYKNGSFFASCSRVIAAGDAFHLAASFKNSLGSSTSTASVTFLGVEKWLTG